MPGISSSPQAAASAAASGNPSMVSWSVSAIASNPAAFA